MSSVQVMHASDLGSASNNRLQGKYGGIEFSEPFVAADNLTLRDFVLPEALQAQITPFDKFAEDGLFPVIDLAAVLRDEESRKEVIAKLANAAESWGFFKVVNHGVPVDLIHKNLAHAKSFFAKDIAVKRKIVGGPGSLRYFGYLDGSTFGPNPSWHEGIMFNNNPDKLLEMALQAWPEDDGSRSGDLLKYKDHMDSLTSQLLELLTEGLGLPSQRISQHYTRDRVSGYKFNHYPPCPRPEVAQGLFPHTDLQTLTVVHQEQGGLQILKDGQWMGIRPDVDSFIVNVGDTLQAWTNGQYRSVKHRVALNTESRISLVYFMSPSDETIIAPITELTDEAHPPKYRPFSWLEYKGYASKPILSHRLDFVTI